MMTNLRLLSVTSLTSSASNPEPDILSGSFRNRLQFSAKILGKFK